jgi:hypothetical protein
MTWEQVKKKKQAPGGPAGGSESEIKDLSDQIPDISKVTGAIADALKKDGESKERREKERRKGLFDQDVDGCCLK